nr:RNA-directed DNA polymerase, eukaryota [Tanacetum cinerariifolium]
MVPNTTVGESSPSIVLDDKCIMDRDMSCSLMDKIKDINALSNLYIILANKGFENVKISYMGGMWVLLELESITFKQKLHNHIGIGSWITSVWGELMDLEVYENKSLSFKNLCVKTKQNVIINDSLKVIVKEEFVSSKHDSDGEGEEQQKGVLGKESDLEYDNINHVSESSCMHEYDKVSSSKSKPVHSEDPFGIYSILKRNNQKDTSTGDDLKYPSVFTPDASVEANMDNDNSVRTSQPKLLRMIIKEMVHPLMVPSSTKLFIISIYAPQDFLEKRTLWDYLRHLIESWNGECVLMGDFNEVRSDQERYGMVFNPQGASAFNNFISLAGLIELPLEGYSFTWSHKSATKMSKLDRFLILKGLTSAFPSLSTLCLDRYLSDHRLILLRELNVDYGPTPFWALKLAIKQWLKADKQDVHVLKASILQQLSDLDKKLDKGESNEELLLQRAKLLKDLHDLNTTTMIDMAQKAKVRWSIEGDENSKFSHGIINKKRSQLAIRRVLFENMLLADQKDDLERDVTHDEIRIASIIKNDVIAAVTHFFNTSNFPRGCNSSFIALIPKSQDAKVVKEIQPISLVGCMYKIIAKILANRLSLIVSDLSSGVQSAFVSNRQILDGPFILNEILSWCKHKKCKAMIFKVDFEKMFDSEVSNITTIVNVLKCFFMASGLKINLHKRKLAGIGVQQADVVSAASESSLWSRVIKAIYGDRGSLDTSSSFHRRSTWLDIIWEVRSLSSKGIDLVSFAKRKVGN